ncbi:MAG TPA: TetR/AcrR family transcriptional regulator [Bryobacteraceae bacterium]|nr:TetR/AcrR family transcriptional regulator [Bryobacteraceae bacterium]
MHRALNQLILEKGYQGVSTKDIVGRANVGRSTFYAHHGSKDDLLLSGFEHLQAALLAVQRERPASSRPHSERVLGFSRLFFEHTHEYRDLLQALLKTEAAPKVARRMKRLLAEVVRNDLKALNLRTQPDEMVRQAAVQLTVDSLLSILLWWFEQRPRLGPAEVDALFRRLVLPGLAAAGVA